MARDRNDRPDQELPADDVVSADFDEDEGEEVCGECGAPFSVVGQCTGCLDCFDCCSCL